MPHSASTQVKDPWIRNLYRTHPGLTLHRPPSPTLPEPWLMLLSESQTRPIDRGSPPRVTHPCFSTYSPRAQDVTDSRPFFFSFPLFIWPKCVCAWECMCLSTWERGQGILGSQLSPSTRWAPGGNSEPTFQAQVQKAFDGRVPRASPGFSCPHSGLVGQSVRPLHHGLSRSFSPPSAPCNPTLAPLLQT